MEQMEHIKQYLVTVKAPYDETTARGLLTAVIIKGAKREHIDISLIKISNYRRVLHNQRRARRNRRG